MNNQENAKASLVVPTLPGKANKQLLDTSSSSPVIIPTPSVVSELEDVSLRDISTIETSKENLETQTTEPTQNEENVGKKAAKSSVEKTKAHSTIAKKGRKGKKCSKKDKSKRKENETSDPETSSSDIDSDSDSSEEEKAKQQRRRKSAAKRTAAKKKLKAKRRSRKDESTSSDDSSSTSDSESESESEVEDKKSRRKSTTARAKRKENEKVYSSSDESDSESSSSSSSSQSDSEDEKPKRQRAKAKARAKQRVKKSKKADSSSFSTETSADQKESATSTGLPADDIHTQVNTVSNILKELQLKQAAALAVDGATTVEEKPVKKNFLEFKRVDQVYDMKIHDWKLVESNSDQKDEFDCVFTARRKMDWNGKFRETQVDIKSKALRSALQEVFKECQKISLVEDTPQIDPHTFFHYYDEIKAYVKKTLKPRLSKVKKSKEKKNLAQEIAQCKLLLRYLDEDFDATRKTLKPMLKAGTITYDLVWALFKPNTIAFTPTYSNKNDPRCFKVDFSYEYESWLSGIKSCVIDGSYLEYDGKSFGLGDHQVMIQAFKGHKKITSLPAYPLKYHKDPEVSDVDETRILATVHVNCHLGHSKAAH